MFVPIAIRRGTPFVLCDIVRPLPGRKFAQEQTSLPDNGGPARESPVHQSPHPMAVRVGYVVLPSTCGGLAEQRGDTTDRLGRERALYADNGLYAGQWLADKFDGVGWEADVRTGWAYVGRWQAGAFHGYGARHFAPNSVQYIGQWKVRRGTSSIPGPPRVKRR